MKYHPPSDEIKKRFAATYQLRRDYIMLEAPTAHDVLERFPRFVDMPGLVSTVYLHLVFMSMSHEYITSILLTSVWYDESFHMVTSQSCFHYWSKIPFFLQINSDFERMFPNSHSNLLTRWGSYFRKRIFVVGSTSISSEPTLTFEEKNDGTGEISTLSVSKFKFWYRFRGSRHGDHLHILS